MVVPFGFSVGDCIAVCILIKDAIKALDDYGGSSTEYQEIIRELWALDRALLEVEMISRSHDATAEMNALNHTVKILTDQCKACIQEFLKGLKGHERSLSKNGSGSKWRDAKSKLGWAMLKKDDLARFRSQINGHSSAINILLLTATV